MEAMESATAAVMEPLVRGVALVNGASPTTCCGRLKGYMEQISVKATASPVALAVGNEQGLCCLIESGFSRDWSIPIFSASKMLSGYVFLRLVQMGALTLTTRAADVLDWWDAKGGGCHNATVLHLLSQTGSLNPFPHRFGACRAKSLMDCARDAYRHLCDGRPLGSGFAYAEGNFFVFGAIAVAAAGLDTYDDVFRKYLADPLGLSESCRFDFPHADRCDPGAGCRCSVMDYGRFLRAALADEIVPRDLRVAAELPVTMLLHSSPTQFWPWHYGIGLWRECPLPSPPNGKQKGTNAADRCVETDAMGVKVSSMGLAGYYPWILRRGRQSHWGVIARFGMVEPQEVSFSMGRDVLPMAAEAVLRIASPAAASGEQPLPPGDGLELVRVSEKVIERQQFTVLVAVLGFCLCLCITMAVLRGLCRLCRMCVGWFVSRYQKSGIAYSRIDSTGWRVPAEKIGEAVISEEEEELLAVA